MSTHTHQKPRHAVTVREIADHLGMSTDFVYGEISSGNLRAWRVGRAVRINVEEAVTYFRALKVSVPTEWVNQ